MFGSFFFEKTFIEQKGPAGDSAANGRRVHLLKKYVIFRRKKNDPPEAAPPTDGEFLPIIPRLIFENPWPIFGCPVAYVRLSLWPIFGYPVTGYPMTYFRLPCDLCSVTP